MTPKFGDMVENGWASENNPRRVGIFVRKKVSQNMPCWELTDGKGDFWLTFSDKNAKLKIIHKEV